MKFNLLLYLWMSVAMCAAQNGVVLHRQAIHFTIPDETGRIDFVIADTVLREKKPVFLWCQGSLPVPLFCEIENYGYYFLGGGITNFNYQAIVKKYHLVVISMPETPVEGPASNLNTAYHYVPDRWQPNNYLPAYLQADYLENYVQRAEKVGDFLKKQAWVDTSRMVVAGHSQGAKVATKIALNNPTVTHLGLFGANPFGRADQFIREARLDAQLGRISWAKADSIMNTHYQFFQIAHHPDSSQLNPTYRSWRTFSETFYDDWLQLNIPLYLAYGTEDRTADLCDIIPLLFIEKGKSNLTLKRYPGLEHNFFEVNAQGKADYEKAHWPEVMDAFLAWIR
ncbi:MAG: hypothetical protein SFV22_19955 [Saprospiraceae bacterium]|nr:hypothetical protein [Saprospiraceae bacterium]